nr:DUF397 domain-containing protein [Streptomyces roseoverticillatus]
MRISDIRNAIWAKSSYSEGEGECVEWAPVLASSGLVPVRDSKNPDGPVIAVSAAAWSTFITTLAVSTHRPG